jgi:hypothetical protein
MPKTSRMIVGALLTIALSPTVRGADCSFDDDIAPLLARHCLGCHNPSDKKGGLDLTRAEGLAAGGDSGPALLPGNVGESFLWQRVEADEMPPSRKPPERSAGLTAAEKDLLRQWIAAGAKWESGPIDPLRFTTDRRAGFDWWSLRPVASPAPPDVNDKNWVRNEIDAFVLSRLEAAGLHPSPPADRRMLIRRLSFDLIGLLPTPEEVAAFVNDPSPRAYEDLVERLLASPHYGERWARHWLDVVRYAESQGFERDRLRPNAWPYRDWVVAALNDDMPYDQFVRWQLAGDALEPDDPQAVIATGFLVAGTWDEVGQTQQSEAMKAVVRQDELEDIVGVTAQTFLGLTANCARCHDHKFDPVSQVDYYRLSAALGGVRHGERDVVPSSETPELAELRKRASDLRAQIAAIDGPVKQRVLTSRRQASMSVTPPTPIARWNFDEGLQDRIGSLHCELHGGARLENGRLVLPGGDAYASTAPLDRELSAKTLEAWVELDNLDQRGGGVMSVQTLDGAKFDAIVFGELSPRRWMAGSNNFVRSKDVADVDEAAAGAVVHVAIVYASDNTITLYRNGRPYGNSYPAPMLEKFLPAKSQIVFGLRHAPPGENKMLAGALVRAQFYDRALSASEVAASADVPDDAVSDDEILACLTFNERAQRRERLLELSRVESRLRLHSGGKAYAVVPREPEPTHVLRRGDTRQPADVVAAGGVAALGSAADFQMAPDAAETERRKQLAEWIASSDNPLTARVIANRLWHYHFGVGIVDTPNDFGFNGGRPSHPGLLDWLAAYLMKQGWSLKQLHRAIVLSATYRQASMVNTAAVRIDAGNRLLWRKTPMRLEAEMLRDAVLAVSGQLNPTMGGPGFQDFRTFTNNSQFYEVIDVEGYPFQRRSLYRTCIRSGTNPLLDVLDCPDPSTTAPSRAVTTTPLQALALLNDSFMLRMADRFAERVREEAGKEPSDQVMRAYRLVFAREPTAEELNTANGFVGKRGLAALCRVMFNANEFLYVD